MGFVLCQMIELRKYQPSPRKARATSQDVYKRQDVRTSGRIAARLYPSFVGISFLPLRSAKPALMSFSMIPARVAVVPNPLRSASSGVSSLPAFSRADRSVSSV